MLLLAVVIVLVTTYCQKDEVYKTDMEGYFREIVSTDSVKLEFICSTEKL